MSEADDLKRHLRDPVEVARMLCLKPTPRRGARTVKVICPGHGDRSPSLLMRVGPDGTLQVNCQAGCGLSGGLYQLLSATEGYRDHGPDFSRLLDKAREMAGSPTASAGRSERGRVAASPSPPPRAPSADELDRVLAKAGPCAADAVVSSWLVSRGLDPAGVDRAGVALALREDARLLPRWASKWPGLGCRLLLATYDATGALCGVRARRVSGIGEKVVAIGGTLTRGVVLADRGGVALLRGEPCAPSRVIVCEGEPDWIALSTSAAANDTAVLGVIAMDSFTEEIGMRCAGREVVLAVDDDVGGDRHAENVSRALAGRCERRDVFASGRLARAEGRSVSHGVDVCNLLEQGIDLAALIRCAPVATAMPIAATEPALAEPLASLAPESPPDRYEAVQRALARLDGFDYRWMTRERLAVMRAIVQHAWWRDQPNQIGLRMGECLPSLMTLAIAADVQPKTVSRIVAFFQERGDIEIVRRGPVVRGGRPRSNVYRIVGPLLRAALGQDA